MNGWLDAQADGLALMLTVLCIVAGMLLIALAAEWWKGRGMRRRQRQRAAYERYCAQIDAEARYLVGNCWRGPESRS